MAKQNYINSLKYRGWTKSLSLSKIVLTNVDLLNLAWILRLIFGE